MQIAEPFPRRGLWRRACAAALAAVLPWGLAQAQGAASWPTKPVRIVIPFAAGSATDIVARTIADELRAELGQSFVVDNRAGANGFIAAEAVARSAPDGYTLFVTATTTHSTNQFLFKKLPYDPVKDFIPVGGLIEAYYVLTVPNTMPVNSAAELAAWLKANPGKASYGWGATVSQIAGATFLKEVGATATGVPYKSSPQAVTDLIGGQLTFMVQDVTTGLAHVKNGRVKALAVSAPARIPQMPDVPTAVEAGIPGFNASTYVGMLAPAGTPDAIIARLSGAVQKALRKPEVAQRLDSCCSAKLFHSTPAEFDDYLRRDRVRWSQAINAAGIQPE